MLDWRDLWAADAEVRVGYLGKTYKTKAGWRGDMKEGLW